MSRVVGSEIAGRMMLDKLAGMTVSRKSVPTTVNPVATGEVVSRGTGEEIEGVPMITT
jgi:hypothetical protein